MHVLRNKKFLPLSLDLGESVAASDEIVNRRLASAYEDKCRDPCGLKLHSLVSCPHPYAGFDRVLKQGTG